MWPWFIAGHVFHGLNVNMGTSPVAKTFPSLHIAALALSLNALPALAVLIGTGYFHQDLASHAVLVSTGFRRYWVFLVRRLPPSFYMLIKGRAPFFLRW